MMLCIPRTNVEVSGRKSEPVNLKLVSCEELIPIGTFPRRIFCSDLQVLLIAYACHVNDTEMASPSHPPLQWFDALARG